ncbi:MAG TPA: D-cysteine desulfhydrase family protein [Candidatus Bathyarchaeia archaeon]|nr:D-cysteine desulfhydrase family protein [Candidatus Bathyarchaeia archaeon]
MLDFDLKSIPRIEHCLLPTPLIPMERLTEYLGKAKIYIKRDDLTGIAFGGNKNRKLEFLLADALLKGSDVIITEGAVTSNHCLQTAACTARLGLDCELVLSDSHIGDGFTGNLLLNQILDTKIHRVRTSADRKIAMVELAENLRNSGRHPYIIPTGGSNKIGVLGYVLCIQEIAQQSANMDVIFDYFIHPTGSAGTQAGILIGKKLYFPEMEIVGIGVGDSKKEIINEIRKIIADFEQEWKLDLVIGDSEIIVMDKYSGEGYGIPNKEMIDAVKLIAKLEGIFLDPVYNGKAMVGLIDLVKSEEIPPDASVLFLHSGGGPALFAYSDVFGKKI